MSDQGETITFADVAGVDEAKEELEEIVVHWTLPSFFTFIIYASKILLAEL